MDGHSGRDARDGRQDGGDEDVDVASGVVEHDFADVVVIDAEAREHALDEGTQNGVVVITRGDNGIQSSLGCLQLLLGGPCQDSPSGTPKNGTNEDGAYVLDDLDSGGIQRHSGSGNWDSESHDRKGLKKA